MRVCARSKTLPTSPATSRGFEQLSPERVVGVNAGPTVDREPMRALELLDGCARGRSVFAIDVELGPVDHVERRLHPFRALVNVVISQGSARKQQQFRWHS